MRHIIQRLSMLKYALAAVLLPAVAAAQLPRVEQFPLPEGDPAKGAEFLKHALPGCSTVYCACVVRKAADSMSDVLMMKVQILAQQRGITPSAAMKMILGGKLKDCDLLQALKEEPGIH
jgi:hypothetical protein